MAGFGFGQLAEEHPEKEQECLRLMTDCIQQILTPRVKAFDKDSWNGMDPIDTLDTDEHHAAYLGYLNLLLSYHRFLEPESGFAALNDRITGALVMRLEKSSILLLETYPGEIYPMDNCAVIASIGLYDRATGRDHKELLKSWSARCREKYRDPKSGLLYQSVTSTGEVSDDPRGSGTTLGLYFLSFSDPDFSKELYDSAKTALFTSAFGFGMMKEYPEGVEGSGDIDSGPILMGVGLASTGFMMAGSRIHGDAYSYSKIYATVDLFGAPLRRGEQLEFVTGGPLGNAIMFAMLTAQPRGVR